MYLYSKEIKLSEIFKEDKNNLRRVEQSEIDGGHSTKKEDKIITNKIDIIAEEDQLPSIEEIMNKGNKNYGKNLIEVVEEPKTTKSTKINNDTINVSNSSSSKSKEKVWKINIEEVHSKKYEPKSNVTERQKQILQKAPKIDLNVDLVGVYDQDITEVIRSKITD